MAQELRGIICNQLKGIHIMKKLLLSLLIAWSSPFALGADVAPDALVKSVTQDVIAIVKQDKDIEAGNPQKSAALVETKVAPHFDFERMTQVAMGRNWRVATPEQQQLLAKEFRSLLIRTYSIALSSYRDQTIDFLPLRAQSADAEVTVKCEVKQPGQAATPIDYDMEWTSAGWKVFDVRVNGVSLVSVYRANFADEVRQHGVDGLIKTLGGRA